MKELIGSIVPPAKTVIRAVLAISASYVDSIHKIFIFTSLSIVEWVYFILFLATFGTLFEGWRNLIRTISLSQFLFTPLYLARRLLLSMLVNLVIKSKKLLRIYGE
jgi:hypothetical protein